MTQQNYITGVATLLIDPNRCIGCGLCVTVCPHAVLTLEEKRAVIKTLDHCMECGGCVSNCPTEALSVNKGVGCASAIIHGWLTGEEPSCDCSGGSSCC